MTFEYTVIPAPDRGEKARNVKTPGEKFSLAFTNKLNEMAADGWEYIRAEVLPSEERTGLTGRTTIYHNVLVFRRAVVTSSETASADPARPFSQPMLTENQPEKT